MNHYKHLTKTDRIKIETLYNQGKKNCEIAKILRVHESTISRELKRGLYIKRTTKLIDIPGYSCDLAQDRYENNLLAKGVAIKIGRDYNYAKFIEDKIADEHYSPAAVLGEIKRKKLSFKTSICVSTLYSYIDKDVFGRITNKDLLVKSTRKRKYNKVIKREHRRIKGVSIAERDESVLSRNEFGHWEMDTVKGKMKSKSSLLVLTEIKTRKEIIIKLPKHTAQAVVDALDKLEEKYQDKFHIIFKTITCDNGIEFSYAEDIMKSKLFKNKNRTTLYYCHPFSSWERGSNEVNNKFIRRYIPKYTDFDDYSEDYFKKIEDFMNNYPRKIFNYGSSEEFFIQEMLKIPS